MGFKRGSCSSVALSSSLKNKIKIPYRISVAQWTEEASLSPEIVIVHCRFAIPEVTLM